MDVNFITLRGSMNYYVVELYVDELEECLVMRCSTIDSASLICDKLSEAFPNDAFDISETEPVIKMRDYNKERYEELKGVLTSKTSHPQLILIQGGKA